MEAAALVISAPQRTVDAEAPSFEQMLATKVGLGYAISDPDRRKIRIGCKVVILDKGRWKRAEATLVGLDLAEKTRTGMQRYNVRFENPQLKDYSDERLQRWGTSVIDLP
jgi:hypothetical protein